MVSGLRTTRSILLAIYGVVTLSLSLSVIEFGMYFGVLLLVSAALTSAFLFVNFDKKIDEKIVIELVIDGFAGLIIFTFPEPNHRFLMLDFSFWIAVMGALYLASGLFDKSIKSLFWLYILSGIMMIVIGFIIVNYSSEYLGSVSYLIGIILTYYSVLSLFVNREKAKEQNR